MWIVEKVHEVRVQPRRALHIGRREFAVVLQPAGLGLEARVVHGAGKQWHGGRIDLEGHAAAFRQLAPVPEQAEAGNIGAAVNLAAVERLGRRAIQLEHGIHGRLHVGLARHFALEGRGHHAGAEALGEQQHVARPGAAIGPDAVRMNGAGDGVTELDLAVVHRVAAQNRASRFAHFLRAAGENRAQNIEIAVAGKRHQRQRRDRHAAHGVDIAQRIGRGDGSIREGIVHDGREEIDGLHQGQIGGHTIHARIVGRVIADQHIRIRHARHAAQDLVQNLWTKLARSTGRFDVSRQPLQGHQLFSVMKDE